MKNLIDKQIEDNNPWYTQEQVDWLSHQQLTIKNRWCFISRLINEIIEQSNKPVIKILDAGCGDGVNIKPLLLFDRAELHAFDYNPLRIERLKEKYPEVNASVVDLVNCKYDGTFDVIILSQVLEHIHEDSKVLNTLYGLLEDNGLLILGVPNEGCFPAWCRNHIFERNILKTTDHVNFYTRKSILKKIKDASYIVEEVMCENIFFPKQVIGNYFSSNERRWQLMNRLNRVLPSWSGGFYFALTKGNK